MTLAENDFMGLQHHDHGGSDFGLAIADQLRRRHPHHTAKIVARAAGVAVKTAENILCGHLSAKSITRLVTAYGLPILIDAGAAITGQTLRDIIREQAAQAREEQARAEDLLREYSAMETGADPPGSDHSISDRGRP